MRTAGYDLCVKGSIMLDDIFTADELYIVCGYMDMHR